MTEEKKKKLESKGFQVGSVEEFLDSIDESNSKIIELNKQYIIELTDFYGENLILTNGKPIGHCECKGYGKESCKGNGWQKIVVGVDDNHKPCYDYVNCPYFKNLEK